MAKWLKRLCFPFSLYTCPSIGIQIWFKPKMLEQQDRRKREPLWACLAVNLPWTYSFYLTVPWGIIFWMFKPLYSGFHCYGSLAYVLIQSSGQLYYMHRTQTFSGQWDLQEFLVQPLICWLINIQLGCVSLRTSMLQFKENVP